MIIITDLTVETSDSDNNNNKKSSSTQSNTVTPHKNRKPNVQTTIERAIMRGYSSVRLQSHDATHCNNWENHNTFSTRLIQMKRLF